jgi:hypothetical protein
MNAAMTGATWILPKPNGATTRRGPGKHATAETVRQPIDTRQQRLGLKDKLFAFRREAQPSGAANDKIDPENSLQLLQSHGKRRRRDIERSRRRAQRAGSAQRHHKPQILKRDHSIFLKGRDSPT